MGANTKTVKLNADVAEFLRNMGKVNKSLLQMGKKLSGLATRFGKIGKEFETAATKINKASGSFTTAGKRASSAAKKIDRSAKKIRAANTAIKNTGTALKTAGSQMLRFGVVMGIPAAASIKMAADFDYSMSRISVIARGTARGVDKDYRSMSKAALDLANKTEHTASQVAQGMQFMAMAGFKATQIIGAMPAVAKIATAGNLSMADAANITTNIMAGYGITLSNVAKEINANIGTTKGLTAAQDELRSKLGETANILVGTFTNANVSLLEMGEAFKLAGSNAKLLNMPMEDLFAMIGLLGNIGVKGTEAGTALKRSFFAMLDPTEKAKAAMKRLGIAAEDLSGKGKSMTLIAKLEGAKKGYEALRRELEFVTDMAIVFGERAGPKMAAVVAQGTAEFVKLRRAIEMAKMEGLADVIETRQLRTTKGAIKVLISNIQSLGIALGKFLLPAIKAVTVWFTELTKTFNEASPQMKKFISEAMLIAPAMILGVGGVARASGGLLDLVGSLGFAAWGLARLKKNTGVMQTLGKLKFTGLRKGISGVGTTLASVYMGTTAASSAWTAFGSKVSGAASSMKTSIGGLIGRVLDLGTRLLWAGGTIAALKAAAVGGVVFTVTTAAMDPEAFFKKDSFSKIKDNITSSLSDTFDLLTKSWRHAVSGFVDWMASISVGLADLFSGAGMSSLGHERLKEATAATRKWADLSVDEAARVEKSWQSVNAAQGGLGSQAKSRPVFAAAMKEEGLSPTGSPKELQGLIKATNEHGKLLKVWGDRIDAIRRVEEFAGKKGDAYNEAKAALGNLDAESIRDLDQEFMKYVKVQSAALSANEKQIDTAQDTNKQLLDLTQALKNVRDSGMMAARGYDKSGKVVDKKIMNPEIRAGLMELLEGQGVDVTKVPYAKGKVVIDDASLAKLAQTMIEANGQMLKRAAKVTPALAGKADTQAAQNQAQFNEILELYKKSVGDDTAKRLRIKLLKKEQKNALKLWKDFFAKLKFTKFFKEANRMAPEFSKVTGGVQEFFKTLKDINTRIKSVIDTKSMKRGDPRIKADVDPAVQGAIRELEGLTAQFIASKHGTEQYAFFMESAGRHAQDTIGSVLEAFPEFKEQFGDLINVTGDLSEALALSKDRIQDIAQELAGIQILKGLSAKIKGLREEKEQAEEIEKESRRSVEDKFVERIIPGSLEGMDIAEESVEKLITFLGKAEKATEDLPGVLENIWEKYALDEVKVAGETLPTSRFTGPDTIPPGEVAAFLEALRKAIPAQAMLSKGTVTEMPEGGGVFGSETTKDMAALAEMAATFREAGKVQYATAKAGEAAAQALGKIETGGDGVYASTQDLTTAFGILRGRLSKLGEELDDLAPSAQTGMRKNLTNIEETLDKQEKEAKKDTYQESYGTVDMLGGDENRTKIKAGLFDFVDGVFGGATESAKSKVVNSVVGGFDGMMSSLQTGWISSLGGMIGQLAGSTLGKSIGGDIWGGFAGTAVGKIVEMIPNMLLGPFKIVGDAFKWMAGKLREVGEFVLNSLLKFGKDLKSAITGIGDLFPEERAGSAFKGTVEQMTPGGGVFGMQSALGITIAAFATLNAALGAAAAAFIILQPILAVNTPLLMFLGVGLLVVNSGLLGMAGGLAAVIAVLSAVIGVIFFVVGGIFYAIVNAIALVVGVILTVVAVVAVLATALYTVSAILVTAFAILAIAAQVAATIISISFDIAAVSILGAAATIVAALVFAAAAIMSFGGSIIPMLAFALVHVIIPLGLALAAGVVMLFAGLAAILGTLFVALIPVAIAGLTLFILAIVGAAMIFVAAIGSAVGAIAAALTLGLSGLLTMFTFLAFKDVEGPYVDEEGNVQEEYKSKREDVFAAFEGALDPLIIALDQLWAGVMPLAGLFATVVKVMIPMAKGFSNTEGISRKLFYALKAVAVGFAITLLALGYFATGVLETIAWMLENVPAGITTFMDQFGKALLGGLAWVLRGFAQFAKSLGMNEAAIIKVADGLDEFALEPASDTLQDLADAARAMKPDLGAMALAIQELMDLTYEEAMAIAEEIAARKGLDLKEFNESLTNIPEGYKVSLARYLSMDEENPMAVAGVSRNNDTLAEMNPDDYFNRLGQSWGGAFGDAYSFIGQLENEIAKLAEAINPSEWADLFGGSLEEAFSRSLEGLDELFAETAEWVVNTVMPGDDAFNLGEKGLEAGLGAGGVMGGEKSGNITNIYVNDMNINDVDDATNFGQRVMEQSEVRSMQQTGNPYAGGNLRGSEWGGGH
jgi:TP901 family phage tail tape measure protein